MVSPFYLMPSMYRYCLCWSDLGNRTREGCWIIQDSMERSFFKWNLPYETAQSYKNQQRIVVKTVLMLFLVVIAVWCLSSSLALGALLSGSRSQHLDEFLAVDAVLVIDDAAFPGFIAVLAGEFVAPGHEGVSQVVTFNESLAVVEGFESIDDDFIIISAWSSRHVSLDVYCWLGTVGVTYFQTASRRTWSRTWWSWWVRERQRASRRVPSQRKCDPVHQKWHADRSCRWHHPCRGPSAGNPPWIQTPGVGWTWRRHCCQCAGPVWWSPWWRPSARQNSCMRCWFSFKLKVLYSYRGGGSGGGFGSRSCGGLLFLLLLLLLLLSIRLLFVKTRFLLIYSIPALLWSETSLRLAEANNSLAATSYLQPAAAGLFLVPGKLFQNFCEINGSKTSKVI